MSEGRCVLHRQPSSRQESVPGREASGVTSCLGGRIPSSNTSLPCAPRAIKSSSASGAQTGPRRGADSHLLRVGSVTRSVRYVSSSHRALLSYQLLNALNTSSDVASLKIAKLMVVVANELNLLTNYGRSTLQSVL